jgi:hypothetical protein
MALSLWMRSRLSANTYSLPSCGNNFTLTPGRTACQGKEKVLFQFGEPTLGRTHQVINGRIARAHLREDVFGGNAAVHHPDLSCFPILRFDLLQEHLERGLVGGVSRQHFVSEGETPGVTTKAMTTCTQSGRLSRL